MNVVKYKTKYVVRLTPAEFRILERMHELAGPEIGDDLDRALHDMTHQQKRVFAEGRIGSISAFKVDKDKSRPIVMGDGP